MSKYRLLTNFFILCLIGISFTTPALAAGLFLPYVTFSTGSCVEAVAIGDVNNDGLNDVVAATTANPIAPPDPINDRKIHVFLQQPNGELVLSAKYPITVSPASVEIGDVNNDGKNDVVVSATNAIGILLQNDSGTLDSIITYPTGHTSGNNSFKVKIGDFNDDGRNDVVSIDWGASSPDVDVFLQNANGTMDPSTVYVVTGGGYDLDVGDVNNDGRQDIVIMGGSSAFAVLLQNSSGTMDGPVYYDLPEGLRQNGVTVGDINGDGRDDVVVTCHMYVVAFYQNESGTLNAPVSYASSGNTIPVDIGDVNGDGLNDVISAGGSTLEIHLQAAGGGLLPYEICPIPYVQHYSPDSLEVGDVNNDGANDVVLATWGFTEFTFVVVYAAREEVQPVPDIKVNAADGPITVRRSTDVTVTASVDAGTEGGHLYDWWMGAITPYGKYWVNQSQQWVKSSAPISMGQIAMYDMPTTEMLSRTLPMGSYRFFFVLDGTPNGVLDDLTIKDYVDVKSRY